MSIMKKILYIGLIAVLGLTTSCNKWFDVNENPYKPNTNVPTADQRLAPILWDFFEGYETAATRSMWITQQVTSNATGGAYDIGRWNPSQAQSTWWYQQWYVQCGVNIPYLIAAAEKQQAWHYIGVAKIIKAWGFSAIVDFYGPMPYEEAFSETFLTKYDTEEHIYNAVLTLIDEGIAELKKTQPITAPSLAIGDVMNNGSTDKWIKFGYGLKARLLNHLSKKKVYNPAAILEAIQNGPASNNDNSVMQYVEDAAGRNISRQYGNLGTGSLTKWYINLLTNEFTGGSKVLDPRIDSLVPTITFTPAAGGATVKYRSEGMDLHDAAFINSMVFPASVYATLRPITTTVTKADLESQKGKAISSGTYYTRKGSKGPMMTYAEMCFIKAEVLFRQSNPDALTAYKEGIKAHMQMLNIAPADMDTYLASAAVAQTTGTLTMSKIMMQKFIAMSYSIENWTDMRRHDYSLNGVYVDYKRPAHYNGVGRFTDNPADLTYWFRRWPPCVHETNYNNDQLTAIEPDANKATYISKPVWWDIPE